VTAHGPIWDRLRVGEPVILDDILADDPLAVTYRGNVGEFLQTGLSFERSSMLVPMMLKDQIVGLVSLSSSRMGCYTEHHARIAGAIAQQAAVAIENARLYEQAQNAAVLAERQRLSRELHDSVSQALYSIALGGKTAHALLEPGSRATEPLEFVLAQAERGLAEMRALIFELRPQALEQEGLVGGLQKLAEALQAREPVIVETHLCPEPDVPLAVKEALYRIAQEAMHNIVKHARARNVGVCLTVGESIVMEIRDDGRGFDTTVSYPGHIGLHSMLERASHLGGTLQLQSELGRGTAVIADFPV
jgi:signal transduction histidine kinase